MDRFAFEHLQGFGIRNLTQQTDLDSRLVVGRHVLGPFHIIDDVIQHAGFQFILVLRTGLRVARRERANQQKDEKSKGEGRAAPQQATPRARRGLGRCGRR